MSTLAVWPTMLQRRSYQCLVTHALARLLRLAPSNLTQAVLYSRHARVRGNNALHICQRLTMPQRVVAVPKLVCLHQRQRSEEPQEQPYVRHRS